MKNQLIEVPDGKFPVHVPYGTLHKYTYKYDFSRLCLTFTRTQENIETTSAYLISEDLVNAVNAAIVTGRPLLLKGDPGCGKTKLARAIARHLIANKEETNKYYFEWHIKSRSTARQGGYTFDHVARLRDATISNKDADARDRVKDAANYIKLGPLGQAFAISHNKEQQPVLLIDEIDKGDIDFPNDLLLELDEMRFPVVELPDTFVSASKTNRPLVIITSNEERKLPPAFLRRCLYYRIPSFDKSMLEKIAAERLKEFYTNFTQKESTKQLSDVELGKIIDKFLSIKRKIVATTKSPSTSELLDWLKVITYRINIDGQTVDDLIADEKIQKLTLKLT